MRSLMIVAILLVIGGCASPQAVEEARADTEALRSEIQGVNTGLKNEVQKLRDDLVKTEAFTPEQVAQLDDWQATVVEKIDGVTGAVAEKVDPILESLEPADLEGLATGASTIGRIVGGPPGTIISLLGAAALWYNERRGRRRLVDGTVGSIEAARSGDTVDFGRAAEIQGLLGIRRTVRDSTMRAAGVIRATSEKEAPPAT